MSTSGRLRPDAAHGSIRILSASPVLSAGGPLGVPCVPVGRLAPTWFGGGWLSYSVRILLSLRAAGRPTAKAGRKLMGTR